MKKSTTKPKAHKTSNSHKAKAATQHVTCNDCALDDICRPIPLGTEKPFSYILDNMERRAPLISGDSLYKEGDELTSIYAVTSGSLKLTKQCHLIHSQFAAYVARNSVEEKVAAFLINLSERCGQSTNLSSKLSLAMSRSDIANFLGIRHETLSRTLSKFQSQELIGIQGKFIYITDLEALRAHSRD